MDTTIDSDYNEQLHTDDIYRILKMYDEAIKKEKFYL